MTKLCNIFDEAFFIDVSIHCFGCTESNCGIEVLLKIRVKIILKNQLSRDAKNMVFGASDQVLHKPACATIEDE